MSGLYCKTFHLAMNLFVFTSICYAQKEMDDDNAWTECLQKLENWMAKK